MIIFIFNNAEYAHDHSDLGAVLNGFSLNEEGQLAAAVEKTGQAIDATYISTTQLVGPRHTRLSPSHKLNISPASGARTILD